MNQQDLHVTYHQFGVAEEDADWPDDLDAPSNGLVNAAGGTAIISTGIHTGRISVSVAVLDAPPRRLDSSRPWEAIAEISIETGDNDLRVRSLEDETSLPVLNPAGAGTYRIRVHAVGRDIDIDGTADTPHEFYLLQVWPAVTADEVTHRATDRYGRQLQEALSSPTTATDEPDGVTFVEWV